MKNMKNIVGLLLLPVLAFADGSDNFNDNSKDATKWGDDVVTGGVGVLTEQNQRLEFTANSPLTDGDTLRPWTFERFPVDADWTIQVDVHNSTGPFGFDSVNSAGLTLLHPTQSSSQLYMEFYAVGGGIGAASELSKNGSEVHYEDFNFGLPTITGAVRMEYNGTTKVVTCYYDTDNSNGYQWTLFTSFGLTGAGGATGNTDWNLTAGQQFAIWIHGFAELMTVSSGQLYLDNFTETGGVPPTGGPAPVPTGNFTFNFPSGNPLLTAIASLIGSYTGTTTLAPLRTYAADVAEDESGKVMVMGNIEGCVDATGDPNLTGAAGAVTTVNNKPTVTMKGSIAGAKDNVTGSGKGTFSGPLEVTDIGGGSNGVAVDVAISAKAAGVPFTFRETASPAPVTEEQTANLKKDWSLVLDISQKTVKGKLATVATAQLTLPNGDVIAYPERTVKYSPTKGYRLSFKKGTNTTVIPNRQDKKSSVSITGLLFTKQGDDWIPSGGTIAYSFLGQRGVANLLDFTGP